MRCAGHKCWAVKMPQLLRSVVLSAPVSLVEWQQKLVPHVGIPQSILSIFADAYLNELRVDARQFNDLSVLGKLLDPVEVRENIQENEALRIHVPSQKHIFEQIVNREIVF